MEITQGEVGGGELALREQTPEHIDGVIAAPKALGEIEAGKAPSPRHGDALFNGLRIGVRGLHGGVILQSQFDRLGQWSDCGAAGVWPSAPDTPPASRTTSRTTSRTLLAPFRSWPRS